VALVGLGLLTARPRGCRDDQRTPTEPTESWLTGGRAGDG